jgi:hypothetical protein
MLSGNYRKSRNSSTAKPHCLRISDNVPLASSPCIGTTVLNTRSLVRFSSDTWLPFWRNSTKPARFSARTTRSPETLGSFGILVRDFDCGPERFAFRCRTLGNAPGLQVQLDCFAKAGTGALDIFSLRSDTQLWAARDIPTVFLGNQRGESVRHKPMLADVDNASKAQHFLALSSH